VIYIRVEMWRHGDPNHRRLLGELEIANDGTGEHARGNYRYILFGKTRSAIMAQGDVTGFPRKRLHVWDLIARCLTAARRG
jgi:hypothetical protein